ncbi:MAG TPA: PEP/pyruvate-binding domain-containing protein, partial [Acidimicrobiia bacterium]|nr:PEP/pyruvate-binding domain-containing protein [Acidimicrobiia bacterium]
MPGIVWFEKLTREDVAIAGGKGANLGELTRARLPVPRGFVVTAQAYLDAMDTAAVRADLDECLRGIDVNDAEALAHGADALQTLVHKAGLPPGLRSEVVEAYRTLGAVRVAVRSSATSEDTSDTSFAGMNQTFTNVADADELCARVVDCWASLFGARVLAYRRSRGITDEPAIAVIVQAMVPSECSGVMFTADPTGSPDTLVIEAAFGLGEVVVGGQIEPDTYRVRKDSLAIEDVRVGVQAFMITSADDGDRRVDLSTADGARRVLTDEQILDVARLGLRVEEHYGAPQDTEWAIANGELFLVQSRPITTFAHLESAASDATSFLVRGLGAAPGRVAGQVRVMLSTDQADALQPGEILVAPMTHPDWVPVLRRAGALVTDGGGMTCHAAIVSRELGVPCVVGTRTATKTLRDGETVTVDAARGLVLEGDVTAAARALTSAPPVVTTSYEPLATRLYVNLAMPDQ